MVDKIAQIETSLLNEFLDFHKILIKNREGLYNEYKQ